MAIINNKGTPDRTNYNLKNKRRQIIEEERVRVLGDALILFYDKLIETYDVMHKTNNDESESTSVNREDIENLIYQVNSWNT